jgi:hypothetical protein
VNVELRRERQVLRQQVAQLSLEVEATKSQLRAVQATSGSTPSLSQDRLDELFVPAGLSINDLTRVEEGQLRVYVVPTDASADVVKAGGAMTISLFDLASSDDVRLASWTVDPMEAKAAWRSGLLFSGYVIERDLPTDLNLADAGELVVQVAFTSSLTGSRFSERYELDTE